MSIKKISNKLKLNKKDNSKIVLVSNIGSLSRKYFVYKINKIKNENNNDINIEKLFDIQFDKKEYYPEIKNFDNAILKFFEIAKKKYNFYISDIDIIAERVVAVGEYFLKHKEINEEYLNKLEEVKKYDILHTQDLIKEIREIISIKEVCKKNKIKCKFKIFGISDSAFHSSISKEIYTLGVRDKNNNSFYRTFGYHGISVEEANNKIKAYKKIIIHLGGGGSITAIKDEKSIYNSFNMTPVSGIMNMTRVGNIDPFIVLDIFEKYKKHFLLLEDKNTQIENFKKEIYEESGMFALTGRKDMREILDDLKSKNKNIKNKAEFAIEVYLNKIVREVGSAMALLNGCDKLIFTGAILEKSEIIRNKLLSKLDFLKLKEEDILIVKTEEEIQMANIVARIFL